MYVDYERYTRWIRSRLPKDIPEEVIGSIDLRSGGYISGRQFWAYGERGPDRLLYEAADEEDLQLWLFGQAAREIAQKMELRSRASEEKKWRYVQDHADQGVWFYRENRRYRYNAICDTRKYWMETELRILYPVFPKDRWMQQVEYYERCMNRWFPVRHWQYDTDTLCFVEISASREVDSKGVEQPAEGTVLESAGSIRKALNRWRKKK